jgi:CRISPR-associated protein Cas2
LCVAKTLKDCGERVQFSVFEARLRPAEAEKLRERLEKLIDPSEDSVRIYQLCETCASKIRVVGQGIMTEDPEFIII